MTQDKVHFHPYTDVAFYGVREYKGGIVHAVVAGTTTRMVCQLKVTPETLLDGFAPITCQDCLSRIANGQGEV